MSMKSSDPIGLYDSGFGGLSVWRAVRDRLPRESLIYLGDGANCPYGLLSCAEIKILAERAVEELLARGCKLIVVACNTATAATIDSLRTKYKDIDIVGMEPAVKPACLNTKSGVVGVIATQRSLEGDLFHRTVERYASDVKVISAFGRGFVEIVENNTINSAEAEATVRSVVDPMVAEGVDHIVLGCSHYPFLIPILQRIAPGVEIVDPSQAVARRVEELLRNRNLLLCSDSNDTPSNDGIKYQFMSFADDSYLDMLRRRAMEL